MNSAVSPLEAELPCHIGPPLHESFSILLGSTAAPLIVRAVDLYRKCFTARGMFENSLYPGIVNALTALQTNGYGLYGVTSKPTVFASQIIDHFQLRRYFQNVFGSDLDGARADKKELIAHILEQEQIHPGDAVMIGDREHDIKGARANGVRAIGVLWGYGSRTELMQGGASALCKTPADLISSLS